MSTSRAGRPLDVVFVIDPIGTLNAPHDTSVALMESAQARGHRVLVTTMPALGVRDGRATAVCTPVTLRPTTLVDGRWRAEENWYTAGTPQRWVLDDADAVFVRTAQRVARALWANDAKVIDGVPNGLAAMTADGSAAVVKIQTGSIAVYAFTMLIGLVVLVSIFLLFR